MNIEIRGRNIDVDDQIRAHVERRLRFSLEPLAQPGLRVVVRLDDVNGPRGGEDKLCRVCVAGGPRQRIVVEDRDRSIVTAVDRAAGRLGHQLRRLLRRDRRSA